MNEFANDKRMSLPYIIQFNNRIDEKKEVLIAVCIIYLCMLISYSKVHKAKNRFHSFNLMNNLWQWDTISVKLLITLYFFILLYIIIIQQH